MREAEEHLARNNIARNSDDADFVLRIEKLYEHPAVSNIIKGLIFHKHLLLCTPKCRNKNQTRKKDFCIKINALWMFLYKGYGTNIH